MSTTPVWVQVLYLVCAVAFILALKGLSGPKTARAGNLVGAAGATVAVIIPFFYLDLDHVGLILAAIAVGTVAGAIGAQRVQMTQMPQMVALFNGVGGGAVALISVVEFRSQADIPLDALVPILFAAIIGSISFWGSNVAFGKLQEILPSRPILLPGQHIFNGLLLAAIIGLYAR